MIDRCKFIHNLSCEQVSDRIVELENENAELRNLVLGMCDLLPHADWPSTECDDRASAYIDQAIELGIEVKS